MKIEISDNAKWNASLTIKIGVLAFLGILFLIPLQLIKSVITERQKNSEKVKLEISDQWALKQVVSGPVLNVPVRFVPKSKEEQPVARIWHILPEKLDIKGTVSPEIRHRGIYKTVVYNSHLVFSGNFLITWPADLKEYDVLWNEAYYTLGISDNRGIRGTVKIVTDGGEYEAVPGVKDMDLFKSGISFIPSFKAPVSSQSFSLAMDLSGSDGLLFIPAGKTTSANISSTWSSPDFEGKFLPAKRTITHEGFVADWLVTDLNRNFPQSWTGSTFNLSGDSFGVSLLLTVDHYLKSFRSVKYGVLFIALTFMVLIFLELTTREKIHLFNYFLMALALVLFFSLLLALSEHTGFNQAYFISSGATIGMISLFTGSLLTRKIYALIIAGILILLYGFIYILLSLNDFAFLAGNIGLFVLLAVVMYFSGRINLFRRDEKAVDETTGQ